jgi:fermentation-respiration switch protein FrsA (DUF1100 family)
MLLLENSLTYFPAKYPAGDWEPAGLKFEDAWFTAADGTKLHGWYVPVDEPNEVVLFCHGNAGNLTGRMDVMLACQQRLNVSLLMFDYRGYGRSEGSPSEQGVLQDARAARQWLAEKAGVKENEIVLWGESIGGGIAVDLAASEGPGGLILEDTFTSLPDVAAYHYPWLPVRFCMRGKLNSLAKIKDYHGPLLMIHGDADTIVPYHFGQKLFAAANEPKQFVTERGYDHNDERSPEAWQAIREFLAGDKMRQKD